LLAILPAHSVTVSFQLSAFSFQLSAFSFQLSAFSFQLPASSREPRRATRESRTPSPAANKSFLSAASRFVIIFGRVGPVTEADVAFLFDRGDLAAYILPACADSRSVHHFKNGREFVLHLLEDWVCISF